jgi:hypothetical protein
MARPSAWSRRTPLRPPRQSSIFLFNGRVVGEPEPAATVNLAAETIRARVNASFGVIIGAVIETGGSDG